MSKKNIIVILLITIIISLLAGITIGNTARKQFLAQDADETLKYCEEDEEVTDCHIEWKYDGIILMEFEVTGKGG